MSLAVFFDIDGTLWDHNMEIPESTKETIARLKDRGVLTFICTGRSKANVTDPRLLSLGFDGIVAACGNYVEMNGKVLKDDCLSHELVRTIVQVAEKCHMPMVMEGSRDYWISPKGFEGDSFVDYLRRDLGEHAIDLVGYSDDIRINKFSADVFPDTDWETIKTTLEGELDFILHETGVVEAVPKGTSKGTGIQWVCQQLGIAVQDTYAVGDSANDIDMLKVAGHSIVMGNGIEEVKALAEYVTTDIHEDGIKNAMEHYGLI